MKIEIKVGLEKRGRAWFGSLDGKPVMEACGPLGFVVARLKAAMLEYAKGQIEAGE